ncbi:hypothetical protein [Pedobacter sp. MW01-1-1]|uniref:hypothetical protein n=1 Tax=Pedobacter sp. MW01-1-1 TaxID=3383027 RepID=UPI003FEF894D
MKEKFTILFICSFFLFSANLKAQEEGAKPSQGAAESADRSKVVLSAHISTQGLGMDVKYAWTPKFAIRGGASIMPFDGQTVFSVNSQPTDLDFKVAFGNAHLLFDWHPFLNEKSLSRKVVVTGGAGYFWQAKGEAVVTYRGTYMYGDIPITSAELGQLQGTIKWNKVAPYAGFGFENVFPRNKFNVGFAVGMYYMGEPEVTLVGTNYLAANTSNQQQLQENMSFYRFMPVVQINFNFGL